MDTATFVFGKWYIRIIFISMPIAALLMLVVAVSSAFALVYTPHAMPAWKAAVMSLVGIYGVLGVTQWFRYRHILGIGYTLGRDGVAIDAREHGAAIPWSRISVAEYFPLYNYIRLTASNEAVPLVLFLTRSSSPTANVAQRNQVARDLIEAGTGRPLARRWVW